MPSPPPQPTPDAAPGESERARSPLPWLGWLVRLATGALVGLALLGPIASGDLFWHLRTGHWILDEGRLPRVDPFSHTAGLEPWILQEYGSQVVFALVERLGGLGAVRVFGCLLALALLVCVQRFAARRLRPAWADLAMVLFAALYALKWELRPHLISGFFALATIELLFPRGAFSDSERRLPKPKAWLALGLLSCVWVQLHAEALFAPILAAAGFIGAASGVLFERARPGNLAALRTYAVCFVSALGGTLASPLWFEPHYYALFRRSVPEQYIEEWFPAWILPGAPRFEPVTLALFGLLIAGVLVALAVQAIEWLGRARGRRRIELPRLAFLGACMVLALKARRFFWLLWFPALELLGSALERFPRLAAAGLLPRLLCVPLLALLADSHYVHGALGAARGGAFADNVDSRRFPVGAAGFVEAADLRGNLFHPYEWGGYLGYMLGDDNPVFIDGRTVLFEDVIPERWMAERDPAVAERVLRDRDVSVIVFRRFVERNGGWAPWRPPGADSTWVRAYADSKAEVWLRDDDSGNVERLAQHWAERGVRFDPARGYDELALLLAEPAAQAELRLLEPAVYARLPHELLERAAGDRLEPLGWLDLAARCAELNLGRAARHALLRGMETAGSAPAQIDARLIEAKGRGLLPAIQQTAAELGP